MHNYYYYFIQIIITVNKQVIIIKVQLPDSYNSIFIITIN